MRIFNYFFASSYLYFLRRKHTNGLFLAAMVVTAIQLLSFFLVVALVNYYSGIVFMPPVKNPVFWIPISWLWTAIIWLYFKNINYPRLIKNFKQLTYIKRNNWAWMTGLIIPVLGFLFVVILFMR